jgi:hypothetical protein
MKRRDLPFAKFAVYAKLTLFLRVLQGEQTVKHSLSQKNHRQLCLTIFASPSNSRINK